MAPILDPVNFLGFFSLLGPCVLPPMLIQGVLSPVEAPTRSRLRMGELCSLNRWSQPSTTSSCCDLIIVIIIYMHKISSFPLGYQRFLLVATSCQSNLATWQLGKMHFITWLPLLTTMALALDRFWIFGLLTSTQNWFVSLCLGVLVLALTLLVFFYI